MAGKLFIYIEQTDKILVLKEDMEDIKFNTRIVLKKGEWKVVEDFLLLLKSLYSLLPLDKNIFYPIFNNRH
ncbi:hypothetical protein A3C98_05185 [Candidatus Roizmanbacteria bacterium RIFCSPHIGHO2_02_FULL_37_15]|uniref:Uncharacterized protein n=1 Tax=Candidatus Roizmanbacteria bacterium RIFCSPLOWO2_01_FULL_37_16 TaxID=1802058 RepID=A0A1F7IPW5_9BACT|nr:MAG: hypothetical protein A2859_00680 [Candidatus Roizmanbacteria bacterium RIFCSPHIGHO2_01_FULL_37_16b]OGK20883.1 MAG: hypothetical protein A3C98_05185 [Candidatus Roizmanbacteria bacterium RIFCSPHIGHO2_02_FULL_37_15]OGK32067.1 MAG: hypothetical protein A3F57_04750 [Candidatus Roizmanbacteria bacterium RIFCSPHIGHO2_12_FULL_36_11]OGK45404.1 MAG: hypothetical protein A3B40_02780 [Candidatus Roizmanbacteria bacterium RIFCSPLOWO2_01_FULL_37_16]OGK57776.1 MAG: hypothetical protein A3I50_04120 [C